MLFLVFQPASLQLGNSTLCAIPPTTLLSTLPVVHYMFAPLQPVTLITSDDGTKIIGQTFTSEGQLRYSEGYVTLQGVFTLPMPVGVLEGFFQINTSSVGRQDNRILKVPLTSSILNGYATQQGIFPLSMLAMVSKGSSVINTSVVGRQENESIVASSASTSSCNGTLFSEETYFPYMNQVNWLKISFELP